MAKTEEPIAKVEEPPPEETSAEDDKDAAAAAAPEVAVVAEEETEEAAPNKEEPVAEEPVAAEETPVEAAKESATTEPAESDAAAPAPESTAPEPAVPAPEPAAAPAAANAPDLPGGLPTDLSGGEGGAPVAALSPQPVAAPAVVAYTPAPVVDAIIEEKGEVSALYVGRVIGKGGEMIRDLQARSAARIDVDQHVPPGVPRVITYRGTRSQIDFAKQLVHMLCQEGVNENDLPLGQAKRELLVVPAMSVGKIIGRGGEMIRELQHRSQAKIQVDHSGASGVDPSEKQVTITGTEESVVKAKEMVLFLVANPNHDAMQSLNMLFEDKLRGGKWGSGPPYPNMPSMGQNMQPGGSDGGYGGGYDQSGYYAGGPPAQAGGYGAPQGGYGAPPGGGGYAAAVPPQQMYPQQGAQAAPAAYGAAALGGGGGQETELFFAAKTLMGRIIGQRGVTVNDLQRRSGCDIQINQDVQPGRDCEITIRGTRQGIETAKQMLREIIEIGPNHPYAGGGAGGPCESKEFVLDLFGFCATYQYLLTISVLSSHHFCLPSLLSCSLWRVPTRRWLRPVVRVPTGWTEWLWWWRRLRRRNLRTSTRLRARWIRPVSSSRRTGRLPTSTSAIWRPSRWAACIGMEISHGP